MTLPLQQAFGRLIRHTGDRGVVAILDPRLVTKPYGKRIVRSLPEAPVTHDFADVAGFFRAA
jgi:ATP-dependent DNA helicase DinG